MWESDNSLCVLITVPYMVLLSRGKEAPLSDLALGWRRGAQQHSHSYCGVRTTDKVKLSFGRRDESAFISQEGSSLQTNPWSRK
jgi:hypothetical protein